MTGGLDVPLVMHRLSHLTKALHEGNALCQVSQLCTQAIVFLAALLQVRNSCLQLRPLLLLLSLHACHGAAKYPKLHPK